MITFYAGSDADLRAGLSRGWNDKISSILCGVGTTKKGGK